VKQEKWKNDSILMLINQRGELKMLCTIEYTDISSQPHIYIYIYINRLLKEIQNFIL